MQKNFMKFTKILVLTAMIVSDLMTPIKVLANEISDRDPIKGEVGINKKVTNDGNSATVSAGSLNEEGDVLVTKTVSKTSTDGRYKIEFEVKGKNVTTNTTITKPVYAVVVFDRSGSMENVCVGGLTGDYYGKGSGEKCIISSNELKPFWKNAVIGAKTFARTLLSHISNAQIALVTYADSSTVSREFSNSNLDTSSFGEPEGGTNIASGINDAKTLLAGVQNDAKKYVVVIGDGVPEVTGDFDTDKKNTLLAAQELKNSGVEVFTIGYESYYGLSEDAESTLKEIATDYSHYSYANANSVAKKFSDIVDNIKVPVPAGTKAVLKDNIGSKFTVVPNNEITVDSEGNVSVDIGDITEEGKKISFDVIMSEQDTTDGWTNVNEGFNLSYKNSNDEESSLDYSSSENQPQVYWERNTYSYTINYYHDSKEEGNLLGSNNTNSACKDATITLSDAEKNAYLNAAGEGYEFNSEKSDSSLIITSDSSKNIINVVYTKKKLTYKVVYLFENNGSYTEINSVPSIDNIPATYGDNVNALTYNNITIPTGYTFNETMTKGSNEGIYSIKDNSTIIKLYYDKNNVKYNIIYKFQNVDKTGYEDRPDLVSNKFNITAKYGDEVSVNDHLISPIGFNLNRKMTYGDNDGKYTITNDNERIYIYYDRSSYKFNVNYHFDGDFDTTYNYSQDAVFGSIEQAKDYILEKVNNKHLTDRRNKDNKNYFLDPELNNEKISIGNENNILNVYYISTEFVPTDDNIVETITKNSDKKEIISSSDKVTYNIKYNFVGGIENIKAGDKIVFTITDQLPSGIDVDSSDLAGGTYNSKNNTITWTVTENIDEFTRLYEVNNKEISITYTVLYNDYISNNGKTITNTVSGNTKIVRENDDIIVTDGVTDKSAVEVSIKGSVIAIYKDTDGNELTKEVKITDLVGKEYSTKEKDFFGYSLKEIKGNEKGTYTEGTIYVEYIYTNTMGTGNIEELPPQTGVEQSNLYNYLIIISMLVLSVRGYKKVKETL